jgi:hypothetical protein
MSQVDFVNAEHATVPPAVVAAIADYNRRARAGAADLGTPLESKAGLTFLAELVDARWPALIELATTVARTIDRGYGAVVLQNLGYEAFDDELRESLVLALTATIGLPTDHVGDRRVLWPVIDRAVESGKSRTFSEALGEAPLHTDSAFSDDPERYNALYCVVEAACGGGVSKLVNGRALVSNLEATKEGRRCIALLRNLEFPFYVPDAFYAGTRLTTAPVLADEPFIRFRHDCIERGFAVLPELDTRDHRWAYGYFRTAAEEHWSKNMYRLRRGEMIVFCNHQLLHARTDYTDPARRLTRVRMRQRKPSAVLHAKAA